MNGQKLTGNFLSDCSGISETAKNPFDGTGKSESLKADLKGYWSRRINDEHRLVYKVTEEQIIIIGCKYHY